MFQWLRALKQTTTGLGLLSIVVLWSGVFLLASQEREHAGQAAEQRGRSLARVFEEYISRVVKETDSQLLLLRKLYQRDPEHFDFAIWNDGVRDPSDLTIQFSITGPDAIIRLSSLGPIQSKADISHSEAFSAHMNSGEDELLIGKPTIGLISGKPSINLTRRLRAPDGSFDGVIAASLDVLQLKAFYNSVDVGKGGVIVLVGLDGIIRARSGRESATPQIIGESASRTKWFERSRQSPEGNYWSLGNTPRRFSNINRLMSFRVVDGLPLIAAVGLAESDIFEKSISTASLYYRNGSLLTVIVLVAIAIGARRQMQLTLVASSLKQTNGRFDAALENMPHGLCVFDREQRLVICNRRYGAMYGLTLEQTKPDMKLHEILEARVAAGNCPQNVAKYIADRLEAASISEPSYIVDELSNDRTFAIDRQPTPDGGSIEIHQDITEIRLMEGDANAAKQELIEKQCAIDLALIVAVTDMKGSIIHANANFCQISGYSRDELLGANHRILSSGVHSKKFFRGMYRRIANGQIWRGELCNKAKDGSIYWVDTIIVPRLGPYGKPVSYMAIRLDITARKLAEAQICYIARHDALTGIASRAVLHEKMEEALARLRRHGETFTIFLLDVDGFKYINDTLGHAAGDELLKQLAHRLKSSLRESELVARLGGDEFAIIQSGETYQRKGAIDLAVRLLEIVAGSFDLDGRIVRVGTSIGIALAPENGVNSGELLKKADLALYRVKSEGRNGFSLFDAGMDKVVAERLQLLTDMREALSRKEFELHYQPVFDVKTREPCGVEALVRWRHPVAGLMPPDRFIWLAEETGLMEPLGKWILDRACADAAPWPKNIKLAVNLSAAQFRSDKVFETVLGALAQSRLPPERLELEITESVLLQNKESNGLAIQQLKNIGISIVLDDFGTGYSSLSYVTTFPFDKIKIDKSFTHGLANRADCAAVVASVLTLARGLDIAVTAEGVETEQQFELLRAAGVNQVQGYLFGHPTPIAELNFPALELMDQAVEAV